MIELLILYILYKYDATIYKVQKLIDEIFYPYSKPSLGTINPALKRLEMLNTVEFEEKMTDGGKLSKIYKITPFGMTYLKNSISTFEFKNQSYLLNYASILLLISEVLNEEEKSELRKNVHNHLEIFKIEITNKLKNPYILYTEEQRKIINTSLLSAESLLEAVK